LEEAVDLSSDRLLMNALYEEAIYFVVYCMHCMLEPYSLWYTGYAFSGIGC
jgi:hypothetical protein